MSESDGGSPGGALLPEGRAGADDVALTEAIARRYFLQDRSKVDIAREFGLSRFQVARLLRRAREDGIVRIEIGTPPGQVDSGLSAAVQSVLGVEQAVVVATVPDQASSLTIRQLGQALAQWLQESAVEGSVVGLGWSRICDALVDQLSSLERCTVVQLAGNLHRQGDTSGSVEAVRRVAAISGGDAYPMYAPMVVEDANTAASLCRQPEIAEAFQMMDHLDMAVVSVGPWGSRRSRVYDIVSAELQHAGHSAGVCGEISGRLFDVSGSPLPDLLDDRVVAITLDQLKRVPLVAATAWGAESALALRATVTAEWVTAVVVDEDLARALIDACTSSV
ncbi:MAG: sugar-binding transcriptional regulator [Nocardioidaceae bacterium]